jgi:hypothetical protein
LLTDGVGLATPDRPLQAYTEALAEAGFVIEQLREPISPDPAKPWCRVPLFRNIVAALQRPSSR